MNLRPQYESKIHKAIRKMIGQKLSVGAALVTQEGKMVYPVNGYLLTTEQILKLDSKNELTSWGIHDLAEKIGKQARPMCPVHKLEMRQTDIRDAAPGVRFYACPETGCDSRFSDKTGYISVFDLPIK